ncbi:MAG: protoporphyrinogen/coproporphyrinogen oxidase [Bacteriovoracaceae bacterium]
MKEADFIIIGAGLAGLATHHELLKKHYSVITLEDSGISGGRVQTKKIGKGLSDTGAQFFTFGYPRITKLLAELKIEAHKASPLMGHLEKDRDFLVNTKNPLGALTSGLLSPKSYFLLFSHMLKLKFSGVKPESPETFHEEGSALDYCRKHLNEEILQKVMVPYFSAFNYADPAELSSALVVRALLHMISGKPLLGLQGGLATLPQALAKGKEIHYNTRALSIEGTVVKTDKGDFKGKHVIIATTASIAYQLLGSQFPSELAVPYKSSVHEGLLVKKQNRNGSYGTLVSPERNPDINVLTDERYKAPGLAPSDFDLLGVLRSSAGAEKEIIQGETKLLNISETDVMERQTSVWKEAIPLLRPGHFTAIKNYRRSLTKDSPVFLAGDFLSTGCAEGAVESGHFIAGLFASRL